MAEHLFVTDPTHSRRILVLEAGPFVLPEHVQNMPFLGGAPDLRVPWVNHPALNYKGLIFAVGGRSLAWGGWSPELLDIELAAWPPATRAALRARYFAESSRQTARACCSTDRLGICWRSTGRRCPRSAEAGRRASAVRPRERALLSDVLSRLPRSAPGHRSSVGVESLGAGPR